MTPDTICRLPEEAPAALHECVHASAVAIGEAGVMIRGPSGGGKSSLAMDLIIAATRSQRFACLVGDDRIDLDRRAGRLIARSHPLLRGLVEKRGLGILRVAHEPAAVVRLVIDIVAPEAAIRFPEPEGTNVEICGVRLPRLAMLKGMAPYEFAMSVLAYLERSGAI